MPEVMTRKIVTSVEEIFHEGGPRANTPLKRGSVMAVIQNPYAGSYIEDIQPFMEDLKPLGVAMAQKLLAALGVEAAQIEGYGKAMYWADRRRLCRRRKRSARRGCGWMCL
mgnify:CR=1 FL=1